MRQTAARIAAAMATLTLSTAIAALAATPAHAASRECKETSKEFPTSGFNTDVTIELCAEVSWSNAANKWVYSAWVNSFKWSDGGGVRKFDKFEVVYRLEHNDAVKAKKTCNWASRINDHSSGSGWCLDQASVYAGSKSSGWTADGQVVYDLDADGQGEKTWDLNGTPSVS